MQTNKNSDGNDLNIRVPKKVAGGGAAGAVLGAVVAGPVGAVVGGAVGALVGNAVEKNSDHEPKKQKLLPKAAAKKTHAIQRGKQTSKPSGSMTPSSKNQKPVRASMRSKSTVQKGKRK